MQRSATFNKPYHKKGGNTSKTINADTIKRDTDSYLKQFLAMDWMQTKIVPTENYSGSFNLIKIKDVYNNACTIKSLTIETVSYNPKPFVNIKLLINDRFVDNVIDLYEKGSLKEMLEDTKGDCFFEEFEYDGITHTTLSIEFKKNLPTGIQLYEIGTNIIDKINDIFQITKCSNLRATSFGTFFKDLKVVDLPNEIVNTIQKQESVPINFEVKKEEFPTLTATTAATTTTEATATTEPTAATATTVAISVEPTKTDIIEDTKVEKPENTIPIDEKPIVEKLKVDTIEQSTDTKQTSVNITPDTIAKQEGIVAKIESRLKIEIQKLNAMYAFVQHKNEAQRAIDFVQKWGDNEIEDYE